MPASSKNSAPQPPADIEGSAVEQPEITPGVFVAKIVDSQTGQITTQIQTVGGVQVTEAQTLLELGVKELRKLLGLA